VRTDPPSSAGARTTTASRRHRPGPSAR
jgi:hypothetical protein